MNLNSLDLNLLVALDALLREASVSRAAMRIGLSQPAASHALQRLRDLIGDPLLVRTGARMELTPRAQALRGPLAQALDQVRGLFIPDDFDAARSERHFRLMMPDLAVELLMPPLMEKVTQAGAERHASTWCRGGGLRSSPPEFARTIDLVISIGDAFKGFHRQRLYTDSDALAVRRGHPGRRQIEEARCVPAARHVAVVIRGQSEDLIDIWLRAQRHRAADRAGRARLYRGAARRRPHRPRRLRAAPPDRGAGEAIVAADGDAAVRSRDRRAVLFYPTRAQMDPGSIWLRKLMLDIGREMEQRKRKAA